MPRAASGVTLTMRGFAALARCQYIDALARTPERFLRNA